MKKKIKRERQKKEPYAAAALQSKFPTFFLVFSQIRHFPRLFLPLQIAKKARTKDRNGKKEELSECRTSQAELIFTRKNIFVLSIFETANSLYTLIASWEEEKEEFP